MEVMRASPALSSTLRYKHTHIILFKLIIHRISSPVGRTCALNLFRTNQFFHKVATLAGAVVTEQQQTHTHTH